MEERENDWATPSMKEFIFWREGMLPEEFEAEYKHYYETASKGGMSEYNPLWKEKQ